MSQIVSKQIKQAPLVMVSGSCEPLLRLFHLVTFVQTIFSGSFKPGGD